MEDAASLNAGIDEEIVQLPENSSETEATMAARTRSSTSSSSKKTKRSKKKDEIQALEEKWEGRFSLFDSKLDKLFEFCTSRGTAEKNPVTSGEQVPNAIVQDSGSLGVRRPIVQAEIHAQNFPTDIETEENDQDIMSLTPGRSERQDIGLFSDDEDSLSMRSDNENRAKAARFSKYLPTQCNTESGKKDTENGHLQSLFGEDAKTKSETDSVGLVLDHSQIDVLSGSWHCENPSRLTAYCEEYKSCFPVHDNSTKHLDIPSLDNFTSDLLVKKHGQKAFSVASKKKTLYSPFTKSVEKLAYQGQAAARMGIVSTCYVQQSLGTLLETLQEKEVNVDKSIQLVRDIFAMSTKALDQVSRAGAFHHLIRRKAVMEDTGLCEIKELKNPLVALPLSSSGVFGDKFEQTLKDRIEKDKQLKELLPELHTESKSSYAVKRKPNNTNDWPTKRPRYNTGGQSKDYPQKSGNNNQRAVNRTSTITKPDKGDNKTEKNTGFPFRGYGFHGKSQQKK